jgi:hypothetical protein
LTAGLKSSPREGAGEQRERQPDQSNIFAGMALLTDKRYF